MDITAERIYELAPFAKTLGITFPELSAARVRAALATGRSLSTVGGSLHGGAIMSLSDVAGAVCTGLDLEAGGWTTVESNTVFLRPVTGAVASATATPVKVGRTLVHVLVDVHDGEGRHCARTTQVLQALAG